MQGLPVEVMWSTAVGMYMQTYNDVRSFLFSVCVSGCVVCYFFKCCYRLFSFDE